jgi:hypothetical protein
MSDVANLKERILAGGGPDELMSHVTKVETLFEAAFTTAFDLTTCNAGVYTQVLLTLEINGFPAEAKAQLDKIKAAVIAATLE